MSFDLHLERFFNGVSACSPGRHAITQLLERYRYNGPDEFGFYVVAFDDGVSVEFSAGGLTSTGEFTGCAFHVRGIGPELCQFIFDVAVAGDFVIFNCQGNDSPESPVFILTSSEQEPHLDSELITQFKWRPICCSSQGLGDLLFSDFADWMKYRVRVIRGARETRP